MPQKITEEAFDPFASRKAWSEIGETKFAKELKADQARRAAQAKRLAEHLRLTERGSLPENESHQHSSRAGRAQRIKTLDSFPPMPDEIKIVLADIIKRYGLPLIDLPSETAAFVVRRVMLDFFRMSNLRRDERPGLFTSDELIALMKELRLKPFQLAQMVEREPGRIATTNNLINRWVHGINRPTGYVAMKIERLIERHVRNKKQGPVGGFAVSGKYRPDDELSTNPDTVRRREQWRAKRRSGDVPVSEAAKRGGEREREA